MGLLSRIFGSSTSKRNPNDDKPPLYGGDGSNSEEAVVVNCASMGMANHLMDRFISERHGTKDQDWKRSMGMFVNGPEIEDFSIRCIGIETSNSENVAYYFDVTRPMNGTKNVAKLMGVWPKDIE